MAVQTVTAVEAPDLSAASVRHEEPNYIAVFIYLAILTALELVVYSAGFPKPVMVGLLVALAFAKALLVAMYFMHLALERKGLWLIAATPIVIVGFAYFMLRPDLSARNWAHVEMKRVVGHHEGVKAHHPAPASQGASSASPQ